MRSVRGIDRVAGLLVFAEKVRCGCPGEEVSMSDGAWSRDPTGYRLFFAPLLALLIAAGALWAGGPAHADEEDTEDGDFVNGEVVVKLNLAASGTNPDCAATINGINADYGTTVKDELLGNASVACIYLLEGVDTNATVSDMADDPRLLYAEPNFRTSAPEGGRWMRSRGDGTPEPSSDPALYEGQYAVEKMGLPGAHGTSEGDGVVVAVLDTGAQQDHPELPGSLVAGYDFIEDVSDTDGPADTPNGIDDDGDGEVDEMTGHGTHVAGIVHLAAPGAEIMPLRVLDSDGRGNAFVIAEAVQYAIDPDKNPATDDGADVINMSLGSSQKSRLLEDVFDDLVPEEDGDEGEDGDGEGGGQADPEDALEGVPQEGVFVAASAGNENVETPLYPAADEGVTGVTSVNEDEFRSEFANYGAWVDIAAPGEEIYSAFPTSQYASWDGTSMAAPFVAGQAALIRSLEPTLPSGGEDGQQSVESVIKDTARSLDATNPLYLGKLGAGHADACASVEVLRSGTSCASSGGTLLDTLAPDTA